MAAGDGWFFEILEPTASPQSQSQFTTQPFFPLNPSHEGKNYAILQPLFSSIFYDNNYLNHARLDRVIDHRVEKLLFENLIWSSFSTHGEKFRPLQT
ncbi:hypothetical protein JHK82_018946 [Glycine max]|nr:hypothetical protein JHK87_018821 [Glycine soja]KAG5023042.1 hypothetical protein JHK85_019384 [Glycine max]KAG5038122.1 hypothetical protein JHK86_018962 [Glycine max]KAG5143251.1 hypothetical protein JHK82_018946 [Glycine max]